MHKILIFYFLSFSSWALSPQMDPRVPYEYYEASARAEERLSYLEGTSALNAAKLYDPKAIYSAPKWKKVSDVQNYFKYFRDTRNFGTEDFPRRIPWMYHYDGCYARAGLIVDHFKGKNAPGKVFLFGKLWGRSPLSNVIAYWWFHVAAVVQVGKVLYVMDASIDASQALTLDAWVNKVARKVQQPKISICSPGTYLAGDACQTNVVNPVLISTVNYFLTKEWNLARSGGKDPKDVLGDHPPW